MKSILKVLLVLMLCFTTVTALASCEMIEDILANFTGGETPDGGEGEGEGEGEDEGEENVDLDGLVLIENGVAKFQIVQASQKGAPLRAKAFADKLKSLGVEVEAPVGDSDADKVAEYEIIFGADIRNREDCLVTSRYLGADGYQIKVVGNKIVIAGGSEKSLSKAYDIFMSQVLKITAKTKKGDIDNLAVKLEEDILKLHEYLISSITVAGNLLSEYTLVLDTKGIEKDYDLSAIKGFRENLYKETGYYLDLGTPEALDTYAHKFVIRYTDEPLTDDDGNGFVAYVDENGDFYAECNYKNAIDGAFAHIVDKYFLGGMGKVTVPANFKKTLRTSVVRYSDFGAVGDGKTDDFLALYNTHLFANEGGQKVEGVAGQTYYINETFTKTIPVKTNVDFCGAKIVVNDKGSIAYKYRDIGLFTCVRDYEDVVLNEKQIDELLGTDTQIKKGDTGISWLAPALETKSLVRITNSKHKDFVRHGSNQNSGNNRMEVYLVEKNGSFCEDIFVDFEFVDATKIEIWRVDDAPIVIENGEFENECCEAVSETKYICVYKSYIRGFKIFRANVTIQNVKHTMTKEPTLNVFDDDGKDKMGAIKQGFSTYGTRDESYPYYGFFYIQTNYNFNAKDCILDGHTTYYEDKPATASTGGKVPDPVAMGSYDLIIEYSSHTYLTDVVQQDNEFTGLGDQRYWGIMSSNGTRNIFFTRVEVNRFDAHRGFWNATLIDTTLGHSFNVIGGGKLYCKNVTKITGDGFISLRGDYGATFNGDMELIDCEHVGMRTYYSNKANPGSENYDDIYETTYVIKAGFSGNNSGGIIYKKNPDGSDMLDENGEKIIDRDGRYWFWDFGYTCYMPRNVILDNYVTGGKTKFVFPFLPDDVFTTDITNTYMITESITFKNMDAFKITNGNGTLNTIKTIVE